MEQSIKKSLKNEIEKTTVILSSNIELASQNPHCVVKFETTREIPFSYRFKDKNTLSSLLEVSTWSGRNLMKVDRKYV